MIYDTMCGELLHHAARFFLFPFLILIVAKITILVLIDVSFVVEVNEVIFYLMTL